MGMRSSIINNFAPARTVVILVDVNDDDASRLADGDVIALFFRVLGLKSASIFGMLMTMNTYS
jgi:hypothetical protein